MTAYYNEIDEYAAEWLRNLIAAGHIASGDVDTRSIEDVRPDDLRGYTQCHFFAGIGVWSHSLRLAGWPDDRPVWTGSCPCQPFSAAGKGGGFADERHLWPAFHHLIRECAPPVVFGEQVASKDGLGWLDLVQADLEGTGYACGAFDTCSAGHGVGWEESQAGEWIQRAIHDCNDPWIAAQLGDFAEFARGSFSEGGHHIRQRLRFVAERLQHAEGDGRDERRAESSERGAAGGRGAGRLDHHHHQGLEGQRRGHQAEIGQREAAVRPASEAGEFGGVAEPDGRELERLAELRGVERDGTDAGRAEGCGGAAACRDDERVAEPESGGSQDQRIGDGTPGQHVVHVDRASGRSGTRTDAEGNRTPLGGGAEPSRVYDSLRRPDPRHSDRRHVDWLFCRDGKWRAVGSGSFPLAHGSSARVGRLRAYGNAVDAEATRQFIEAYLEAKSI